MKRLLLLILLFPLFSIGQNPIKGTWNFDALPVAPPPGMQSTNGCCAFSTTLSTTIKRTGTGAIKDSLKRTDPNSPSGSKRVEQTPYNVIGRGAQDSTLRWWQYYTYMDSWSTDVVDDIFSQWHDNRSDCSTSPPLAFRTINGNIYLDTRYNLTTPNYCANLNNNERISYYIGPVVQDVWVKWTIYYRPALDGAGDIIVWKDGVIVLRITGPNDMRGTTPHYWKFGIYKWPWASANYGGSTATERVILFDDMKIGSKTATVADFEPAAPTDARNVGQNKSITGVNILALQGPAEIGGFTAAYQWQFVSGPTSTTFTNATSANTNVGSMTINGTYVVRLRIRNGSTDTYEYFSITRGSVTPPANQLPTTQITTANVFNAATTSVNLTNTSSDPDGTISTYLWSQTGGTTHTITSPSSSTTTFTGLTPGPYQVKLIVTDNSGGQATDYQDFRVNYPPMANPGSSQILTNGVTTFNLTGIVTDVEDGTPAYKRWRLVSGPNTPVWDSTALSPTVTGATNGIYEWTLTTKDSDGDSTTNGVTVTINIPPTVDVSADVKTISSYSTTLDATVSDDDGTIVSTVWTEESHVPGHPSTIVSPNSTSTAVTGLYVGQYIFKITVTDNLGSVSVDYVYITVTYENPQGIIIRRNSRKVLPNH